MPNRTDSREARALRLEAHRFETPETVRGLGAGTPASIAAETSWARGWEGPTLAELAERVEHQFGDTPGLAGIFTLGFGRDEPLTPSDIHQVCEHLGLPAEDFGVGN